jgi:hypothetical protein
MTDLMIWLNDNCIKLGSMPVSPAEDGMILESETGREILKLSWAVVEQIVKVSKQNQKYKAPNQEH